MIFFPEAPHLYFILNYKQFRFINMYCIYIIEFNTTYNTHELSISYLFKLSHYQTRINKETYRNNRYVQS